MFFFVNWDNFRNKLRSVQWINRNTTIISKEFQIPIENPEGRFLQDDEKFSEKLITYEKPLLITSRILNEILQILWKLFRVFHPKFRRTNLKPCNFDYFVRPILGNNFWINLQFIEVGSSLTSLSPISQQYSKPIKNWGFGKSYKMVKRQKQKLETLPVSGVLTISILELYILAFHKLRRGRFSWRQSRKTAAMGTLKFLRVETSISFLPKTTSSKFLVKFWWNMNYFIVVI